MTLSPYDMILYSGALFILFLTPGPVWVALLARALSGGFNSAWPLAMGVVVGDVIWPLVAIFGLTWLVGEFSWVMEVLRWVAVAMFLFMGVTLILKKDGALGSNSSLTRPGMWAGFIAGVVVIMSNPKAVLFYMGLLPGFFDLTMVTWLDIAIICFLSFLVPLLGNLVLALLVHQVRGLLQSPKAVRRLNTVSGLMMIAVAGLIAFT